jgi:three-Cys-motif partner protein
MLPPAEPDELHTPEIGEWGRQKYLRLWVYANIFTTGMKGRYSRRVYIDLFAGAGKARIRGTGEWQLRSPLLALAVPYPFTDLIFCEESEANVAALTERVRRVGTEANVRILHGKMDDSVDVVRTLIPRGGSTLAFTFLDPYDLSLTFESVARLVAGHRMDILVLLAAQMDGQRNIANYLRPESQKIARLLGDGDWRDRWAEASARGENFQRFLVNGFTQAMVRIGYAPPEPSDLHTVRTENGQVPIYHLLFFSRHPKGYDFWRKALKSSVDQGSFFDVLERP